MLRYYRHRIISQLCSLTDTKYYQWGGGDPTPPVHNFNNSNLTIRQPCAFLMYPQYVYCVSNEMCKYLTSKKLVYGHEYTRYVTP